MQRLTTSLFRTKTRLLVVGAMVAVAGVLLAAGLHTQKVSAQGQQDCTKNSIITCGAQSPADLVDKIKADKPGDLAAIYSAFGLTPDKYDDFVQNAKMATAYKNGDIKVDDQVVAHDTWSIGREKQPKSELYKLDSATYYRTDSQDVFAQDSLKAMVLLDGQGKISFAVLNACGNPMSGVRVTPPKKEQPKPVAPVAKPKPTPTPPAPQVATPVAAPPVAPPTPEVAPPVAPAPVAPALPDTGPAGVVGIFGGASVLGTLGYHWRARRRVSKVDQLIKLLKRT